jgi:hypothetical protein
MKLLKALLALALIIATPISTAFAEERPAASAGDAEYEKALVQMVVEAEKLGVLFAGVSDAPTAQSSLPHITAAINELDKARAKGASLPKPAKPVMDTMSAKYGARLRAAMTKLTTEANRINGIAPASGVLKESLAKALKK